MAKKRPKIIGNTDIHAKGGITRDELRGSYSKNNDSYDEEKKEIPMIKIGKAAPDFQLSAFHKDQFKTVKLSDYKGKWVLLCFYPGDFTFVWGTEVSAVAGKYSEFQELGVEVLSCSVDSVFIHKIWNEVELSKMVDGGIPYPMIEDKGGLLGTAYGVYDEEAGVNTRGRFLIDPDGNVQAMEVLTPPVGRNVSEAIRQIKAFQHVRNTAEAGKPEVTPSGWNPGDSTLQPTFESVGNIWKQWNVDKLEK